MTKPKPFYFRIVAALLVAVLGACATSPLGRSQVKLYSEADMARMGEAAFAQMRKQTPEESTAQTNTYVSCVARAITSTLRGDATAWEVVVFKDDQVNAFALPGGKIGIYTGLLKVAETPDQLAAVIGHEIAHVRAEHANERMSTSALTNVGLQVAGAIAGSPSPQRDRALAALGLGVQVGVLLPFGRTQEEEADLIGLDVMADAGFDPRESVELWRNMARESGPKPPEFLSTHPSSDTRIAGLQARMPSAIERYERARAAGRRPDCRRN